MYYVYALRSKKDGHLYVGMSADPERRLKEHNAGGQKSTKNRQPFEMIYKEVCPDRAAARVREKQLKSGYGRNFLKKRFIPR